MSELYLVLRERIHAVAEGIEIATDVLQQAQDASDVLGLEIERPSFTARVEAPARPETGQPPTSTQDALAEILATLERLEQSQDRMAQEIAELREAAAPARRSSRQPSRRDDAAA